MKPELRKVHCTLDGAVDRLYRTKRFESDRERVEHLFGLYERLTAPLAVSLTTKTARGRRRII